MPSSSSSCILDATARFPGDNHPSMEDYARACSDAVDTALDEWPVVTTTKHAGVRTGFFGDDNNANQLRSVLWTQSFEVVPEDDEGTFWEDLLVKLRDVFSGENLEGLAKEWDTTFAGATLLGKLSESDVLVRWKFNQTPRTPRDMLYVVHKRLEEPGTANDDGPELRLTYAYASVSEDWASEQCRNREKVPIDVDEIKRVRALNCFPSCDRITVYDVPGGGKRITLDNLMTTDLGGWHGPFCFHSVFQRQLEKANTNATVQQCEAMRDYAVSLCRSSGAALLTTHDIPPRCGGETTN